MPAKGSKLALLTDADRANILSRLLKEPNKSAREIWEESGMKDKKISLRSVARVISRDAPRVAEVAKTGEPGNIVGEILKNDEEILRLGTKLVLTILGQLQESADDPKTNPMFKPSSTALTRVAAVLADSTKRRQLFTGQPTDDIRFQEDLTDEQRARLLRRRPNGELTPTPKPEPEPSQE